MITIIIAFCIMFLGLCIADYLGKVKHVGLRKILDAWVWASKADESSSRGRYK